MTFETVIVYLFAATSILYIIHFGLYLIGACVYDVWQSIRQNHLQRNSQDLMYQPDITILVPAHNEEKVIERCLDSIFSSTYRQLSVIVVNDASTDTTRKVLRNYQKSHSDKPLRIVNKRINVGKGAALNYALRRYVRSELVMMIDADSALAQTAISNAVTYFINPSVAGVAANVQIISQHTTLGMLQKFEHMISYQSKKAYSITNCDYIIGGVASTYRTDIVRSANYYDTDTLTEDISLSLKIVAKGNRAHRLIYAADVVALTEPVGTFGSLIRQRYRWKYGALQNLLKHTDLIDANTREHTNMLTMYRLPMAIVSEITLLLLPLVWLYAIYITYNERSLLLVIGAYFLISSYTLITLLYNAHLTWRERVQLIVYVPIMYFLFYIMDIIQVTAVVRCLARMRTLVRREQSVSTWVSPERLGNSLQSMPVVAPLTSTGKRHE